MFDQDLTRLDADATLAFAATTRAVADRAEVRLIEAAAHWADLHGVVQTAGQTHTALPGTERLVQLGGQGTPEVAEFAPAELGAELALSSFAAERLVGDALDLRHRLPRLWSRILAGEVKPWIGRKTAELTRALSPESAGSVDRRLAPWAHGLSWGRIEAIIEAARIEADPAAAAVSAEAAASMQGVWLGQANDHGIKDIYIRTEAPAAIWFDASIDRIADDLARLGDEATKDVRRARAVGVLAQPQRALDLFARAEAGVGSPNGAEPPAGTADDAEMTGATARAMGVPEAATAVRTQIDPRPPVTLYVHLSADSLSRAADGDAGGAAAGTGGVARVEGIGAVTGQQVKAWLGGCDVTVKPVIDLAGQVPVDGYEVPDRLREAVRLRTPVDAFPYGSNLNRSMDFDHTEPHVDPADGGPPGQTRADNLAPMTRRHHRIKTHGRWQVRQPFDGVFIWRSPHNRYFVVDHGGTSRIPRLAA